MNTILNFLKGDWETLIRDTYGGINEVIDGAINILTMSPDSNAAIWTVIQGVFNIVLPVGFTLASVFILISLISKAALFKLNNYENIVKMFLVVAIGKLVLENSFELLAAVYEEVANLISAVGTTGANVSDVNTDALVAELKNVNMLQQMVAVFQLMPINFVMMFVNIGIIGIAYGRLIEIYVHMALAPIPLATCVSEEYSHIGKKFIQSYVAVCLQGLVMLIVCSIFSGLSSTLMNPTDENSFMGGGVGFIVAAFTLLGVLFKSGTWAKQIVGLM